MSNRKIVIYPGVPTHVAAIIIDSWRERHENDKERTSRGVRFKFKHDYGEYYAYQTKTQIVIKVVPSYGIMWPKQEGDGE